MNGTDKAKLETLRQRIPVGLRHAMTLLESVNGDVEQAEKLFQQEMIALVIERTGVTEDAATKYLIKNTYDIHLALKDIYEESYSLTERILRRYKNKEEVLDRLVHQIEKKHQLVRKAWLNLEDFKELPQELFCFVSITEWLNYSDYEGFDIAMYAYCDVVTEQIEKELLLPEIANVIRKAKEIHESKFEQRQIEFEKEGSRWPDPEFRAQEDLFDEQKPLLIDTLYEFAKKHIDKFP